MYLDIRFVNSKFIAAKEKLEIVSGATPPPFRIFAGEIFWKNAFWLIQEYSTSSNLFEIKNMESNANNKVLANLF